MRCLMYLTGLLVVTSTVIAAQIDTPVLENQIAQQSIAQIIPAIPSLDTISQQAILKWIHNEPELVKQLIKQDDIIGNYKEEHQANKDLLTQKNIINLSPKGNYIFVCPTTPDYIIKISGPSSRFVNTMVANDTWPTTFKPEDIATFKKTTTYQTASSLVTYALCTAYAQKNPLPLVYIPRTYIITIHNDTQAYTDQNCVIVQERLALVPDEQRKLFTQQLSEAHLTQLIQLVVNCGIWSLSYDNINFLSDGRIVLTDLEQPNVCNPLKGFYHIDQIQWRRNITAGFDDLKKLIEENISDTAKKGALIASIERAALAVLTPAQ